MVAAILLIAFTVAVGGLISVWITSYATTTTSAVEASTVNATKCAGNYISVESVSNNTIIFINPNSNSITTINITTNNGNFITPNQTSLGSGWIGTASWSRGTNTSILITGLCLSSVLVTGNCDNSQTCWKNS